MFEPQNAADLMEHYRVICARFRPPSARCNRLPARERPEREHELPMARIACICADAFGVTVKQLKGERRYRQQSAARQAAMYLTRRFTSRSLCEIGHAIGNRDHSTVLYGIKCVDRFVEKRGIDCGDDVSAWAKALAAALLHERKGKP